MEDILCSPLSWAYYYQDEGIEDIKHSLLYSTLELENAILSANEEIARKDDELIHLKTLLTKIIKERDEAQAKCQTLMLEKQLLFQQLQVQKQSLQQKPNKTESSPATSNEDPVIDSNNVISSDCDENIVASPGKDTTPQPPLDAIEKIAPARRLPEKGRFLQAVMEAGPLLQTLLLAGPLPQWQHPPPQLNTVDIPPVTISSPRPPPPAARLLHQNSCLSTSCGGTRGVVNRESPDFSPKYQKVAHH